jgi:hypothetical protein
MPGGGGVVPVHEFSERGGVGGGGGGRSSSSTRSGSSSQGARKQNAGAGSTVTADQASIAGPAAITAPNKTGLDDIASTYFQGLRDGFVSNIESTWEGLTLLATSPLETREEAASVAASDPSGTAFEILKPFVRDYGIFGPLPAAALKYYDKSKAFSAGYQESALQSAMYRVGEYEGSSAADVVVDAATEVVGGGVGAVVGNVARVAAKAAKNVVNGYKAVAKLAKAVDEVAAAGKTAGTLDDAAGTAGKVDTGACKSCESGAYYAHPYR